MRVFVFVLIKPITENTDELVTEITENDLEKKEKEVVIGWSKYYGRMVERGTEKMYARAHMYPLWEQNEEKYYKIMLEKAGLTP